MERKRIMDFSVSTGTYSSFIDAILCLSKLRKSANVCVANVHMFIEAYWNRQFRNIINEADIVTPDGKPLTWGLHLLHKIKQDRVAGMDLLPDLLQAMTIHHLPVYFYGGSPELLEQTHKYLINNYPDLKVAGLYSPPFRELYKGEEQQVINAINSSGASLVFVILGCPRQEKWMSAMKGEINAVMIGVGGALPVLIGLQKRAPQWMQDYGLEWLFRLLQEPGRLFKRYAVTNSLFLYLMFKEALKVKLLRKALR
jgi:N-acetylglucosaminyldiphosphoundecaprenol N-acetyl-beta-D-mannosaminyltransferase